MDDPPILSLRSSSLRASHCAWHAMGASAVGSGIGELSSVGSHRGKVNVGWCPLHNLRDGSVCETPPDQRNDTRTGVAARCAAGHPHLCVPCNTHQSDESHAHQNQTYSRDSHRSCRCMHGLQSHECRHHQAADRCLPAASGRGHGGRGVIQSSRREHRVPLDSRVPWQPGGYERTGAVPGESRTNSERGQTPGLRHESFRFTRETASPGALN